MSLLLSRMTADMYSFVPTVAPQHAMVTVLPSTAAAAAVKLLLLSMSVSFHSMGVVTVVHVILVEAAAVRGDAVN